jgi:acetylornithine/succinyldiaminopimelate/putrescine aminotransferase
MRKQLVDAFAAMAQSNLGHAADKLIGALTHLAELRIHVEALRTHKCPPSYAVPPALSQSLELQADKGTVTVATWSFRCR